MCIRIYWSRYGYGGRPPNIMLLFTHQRMKLNQWNDRLNASIRQHRAQRYVHARCDAKKNSRARIYICSSETNRMCYAYVKVFCSAAPVSCFNLEAATTATPTATSAATTTTFAINQQIFVGIISCYNISYNKTNDNSIAAATTATNIKNSTNYNDSNKNSIYHNVKKHSINKRTSIVNSMTRLSDLGN